MSDYRLDDVVQVTNMGGPSGKYVRGACMTCSQQYKVYRGDFTHPTLKRLNSSEDGIKFSEYVPVGVNDDFLEYVASMRAWNCCHEGEEPLDGYPEQPDEPAGFAFEQ